MQRSNHIVQYIVYYSIYINLLYLFSVLIVNNSANWLLQNYARKRMNNIAKPQKYYKNFLWTKIMAELRSHGSQQRKRESFRTLVCRSGCHQITRSGRIVPDREYRHKLIQRAHQRHVRECLAQAIFHKVLEMEVGENGNGKKTR